MNQTQRSIPDDALCAVEGCGHRYDLHDLETGDFERCGCEPHYFKPRVLARAALNAAQEREAYEQAMKGDA